MATKSIGERVAKLEGGSKMMLVVEVLAIFLALVALAVSVKQCREQDSQDRWERSMMFLDNVYGVAENCTEKACRLDARDCTSSDLVCMPRADLRIRHTSAVGLIELWNDDFVDVDLAHSRLKWLVLPQGSNLTRADLTAADLRCADLRGADLKDATLRSADLSGALLPDSKFLRNVNWEGAICPDGQTAASCETHTVREREPGKCKADFREPRKLPPKSRIDSVPDESDLCIDLGSVAGNRGDSP